MITSVGSSSIDLSYCLVLGGHISSWGSRNRFYLWVARCCRWWVVVVVIFIFNGGWSLASGVWWLMAWECFVCEWWLIPEKAVPFYRVCVLMCVGW